MNCHRFVIFIFNRKNRSEKSECCPTIKNRSKAIAVFLSPCQKFAVEICTDTESRHIISLFAKKNTQKNTAKLKILLLRLTYSIIIVAAFFSCKTIFTSRVRNLFYRRRTDRYLAMKKTKQQRPIVLCLSHNFFGLRSIMLLTC